MASNKFPCTASLGTAKFTSAGPDEAQVEVEVVAAGGCPPALVSAEDAGCSAELEASVAATGVTGKLVLLLPPGRDSIAVRACAGTFQPIRRGYSQNSWRNRLICVVWSNSAIFSMTILNESWY